MAQASLAIPILMVRRISLTVTPPSYISLTMTYRCKYNPAYAKYSLFDNADRDDEITGKMKLKVKPYFPCIHMLALQEMLRIPDDVLAIGQLDSAGHI